MSNNLNLSPLFWRLGGASSGLAHTSLDPSCRGPLGSLDSAKHTPDTMSGAVLLGVVHTEGWLEEDIAPGVNAARLQVHDGEPALVTVPGG